MKSGINILGAVGITISIGFMTATALADKDGHSWFGKNHGAGWHGGGSWHGEGGGPGYRSTWFDPWGFSFGAYEGPGYYYYPPLLADYYPPRSSDYHADTDYFPSMYYAPQLSVDHPHLLPAADQNASPSSSATPEPQPGRLDSLLPPVSVTDIKLLAKTGVSDAVILSQIRNSHAVYHLNSSDVNDLKSNNVSKAVIDFTINTATPAASQR